MKRALLILLLLAVGLGGGFYLSAGFAPGPRIEILRPTGLVGRESTFEAAIDVPNGELRSLEAAIEQGDRRHALFSLAGTSGGEIRQDGPNRIVITRRVDRQSHPDLVPGPARIVVSAVRPVLYGLRERPSTAAVDVEVRLDPPRLQVLSTFHHVRHGGTEMIVYRVTPPDAESGVQVGERYYPGYPGTGARLGGDPALRVAFFALTYDQDLDTSMELVARDAAGNEGRSSFDYQVFPRSFRRSVITIGDDFLRRVVPSIVDRAPELADEAIGPDTSTQDLLQLYLFINGRLRERNRSAIEALAASTSDHMQWMGPFQQLASSQVESGFADYRTYEYAGTEVDQQVHLGFDLASTANAPVLAANRGTVVFADYLGIYGNCVVVDHGMGLQSLYAHLSSVAVAPGEAVESGHHLGLSGQTGLAGGDHLHFTMLLQGHPVTPVEWWDAHWIEDRIMRKLRHAGASS